MTEQTTSVIPIESEDQEEFCARCGEWMQTGTEKVEVDFRETRDGLRAEADGLRGQAYWDALRVAFPKATAEWGTICRRCEAEVFASLPKYSLLCSDVATITELFAKHPDVGQVLTQRGAGSLRRGPQWRLLVEVVPQMAGVLEYLRGVEEVTLPD